MAVLSLCGIALKKHTKHFNSRPSARGDDALHTLSTPCPISIHAPPRGATPHARRNGRIDGLFQFTPLREGRRFRLSFVLVASRISIHAPPRGATRAGNVDAQLRFFISIHAPPRGATRRTTCARGCTLFQFTPLREGRQQSMQYNMSIRKIISIHAPPRGATAAQMFQAFLGSYFNSRPSARGDVSKSGALVMNEISIHAPPRGATRTTRRSLYADVFQFTPLREGRPSTGNPAVQCQYFNSRPSARGDLRHKRRRAGGQFQFTPLREGRRPPFAYPPVQAHFNSRPSARGDNSAAERPEARPANFNSRPSARGVN